MKTLKDVKARIKPFIRLRCVNNTKRPELNGTLRIVQKTQRDAFTWKGPADDRRSWTYWAPAATLRIDGPNTFTMAICHGRNLHGAIWDPVHTVTLEILE